MTLSRVPTLLILVTVIYYLSIVSANIQHQKFCARLFENKDFEGEEFQIKDMESLTNLEETHLRLDKNWNVTESFKVESGCLFTACNESHFNGICHEFISDTPAKPDAFETILSANCTCASNCKCSDVFMRKTSCARAYLNNDCNTCNVLYTDLKGQKEVLPENFKEKVKSVMVRKGCSLTVYDEEDFDGESEIFEDIIIENWTFPIVSYECTCVELPVTEWVVPARSPKSPPFIDIPPTADNITAMMKTELGKHPGLVAALKSVKEKRSPTNAYILLIGLTGAGKSSAINLLFDNPNVTKVGDRVSTTSDIHEFRIPVPVDHLGIQNSELRVIDTPGLGDTRGLEQDARFLATLDDYLANHEELNKRIPNIVLVFAKFHENRFDGPGATFVKMLRGVDSFRDRITDKKFSNVIFVFSHFMSVTRDEMRKPATRLKGFKSVIEEYSLFPKPISIVVAENKAAEQDCPLLNGYFKLPNGDYYPRNLYEKMEKATLNGNDPIGEAVFGTAFSNSDNFNVTKITHTLVSSKHNKVAKYLAELSGANFDTKKTEVSEILATAFVSMHSSLTLKFPDALPYLQRSFNIRNILTKADVPRTTHDIVRFLKDIKQNEANIFLMEKAFGLKAPTFKEDIVTGYGYNVMEDKPLLKTPFVLGDVRNSDIGYMFPNALTCNLEITSAGIFKLFENQGDYLNSRLQSLNVEGEIPVGSFFGELKPGYNIQSETLSDNRTRISALKEHRTFELILNDRLQLNDEFTRTVKSLPKYNESEYESVDSWKNFFSQYGTHVVKSAHGGGSIEIVLISNSTFGPEIAQAMFELIEFAEDITMGAVSNNSFETAKAEHFLKFRGGDIKFHASDLKLLSLSDAANVLEKWKESLGTNPSILYSEMRLLPMSEVTKKLGQNISSEIQAAAKALFNSSMIYRPPSKITLPPPDRDLTGKLMQQMMEQLQMSNKRMDDMMTKMQENQLEQSRIQAAQQVAQMKYMQLQEELRRNDSMIAQAMIENLEEKHQEEMKANKLFLQEMERKNQEALKELARNAEIASEKQRVHMSEMADKVARSRGGSCLKKGTMILMADGTEKAVEEIRMGDVVLDGNLNPTQVVGAATEFLMDQHFYGFENTSYFFTNTHLLVGRDNSSGDAETLLYTPQPGRLYEQNPLMEYFRVRPMNGNFEILTHDREIGQTIFETVSLVQDPMDYSNDTLVYFFQVDNPEGTYIANGYVCRHEVPPVHLWPKTIGLLFAIASHPDARKIANLKYTIPAVAFIKSLVDDLRDKIEHVLEEQKDLTEDENDGEIIIGHEDMEGIIVQIFGNPSFSSFSMGFYGATGKALADRLDFVGESVGTLQKLVYQAAVPLISNRVKMSEFTNLETT